MQRAGRRVRRRAGSGERAEEGSRSAVHSFDAVFSLPVKHSEVLHMVQSNKKILPRQKISFPNEISFWCFVVSVL